RFITRTGVLSSPRRSFKPGVLATGSPNQWAALESAGTTRWRRTGSHISRPSSTITTDLPPTVRLRLPPWDISSPGITAAVPMSVPVVTHRSRPGSITKPAAKNFWLHNPENNQRKLSQKVDERIRLRQAAQDP